MTRRAAVTGTGILEEKHPIPPRFPTSDAMTDQASDLRRWVRDQEPPERARIVALTAGKGGVGTTSAAVALAQSFAREGRRVLILDGDPCGGDLALGAGTEGRSTIADVLAGRKTLHEVREAAGQRLDVVAGHWGSGGLADGSVRQQEVLLSQMRALRETDIAVVDLGVGLSAWASSLAEIARSVLVVVSPEPAATLAGYAALKVLGSSAGDRLGLLVNRAGSAREAEWVHRRIARVARRFLAMEPPLVGWLPIAPAIAERGAGDFAKPAEGRVRFGERSAQELARAVWDRLREGDAAAESRRAA